MCSGELAAEAATAAAAARLRWRREAGWDPRFLLLVLEVLLTMALAVVVASCGTVAVLLSGGRSVLAAFALSLSSSSVTSSWLLCSVKWLDRHWGLLHGSVSFSTLLVQGGLAEAGAGEMYPRLMRLMMMMVDLAFALMPKRLAIDCRLRRGSVRSLLAVRVAAAVVVVCGMSVLALSVSLLAQPHWLIPGEWSVLQNVEDSSNSVSVPGGHGLLGVVAVLLLAAAGAAAWVDGGSLESLAGIGRRTARRFWERCFFFLFDRRPAGAIFHWLAILPTRKRAVGDAVWAAFCNMVTTRNGNKTQG